MSPDPLRDILMVAVLIATAAGAHAADGTHQDLHQQVEGVVDSYDASASFTGEMRDNSRGGHDVYDASNALVYGTATGADGDQVPTTAGVQPPWATSTPDYSGGFTYLTASGAFFWQQVPNYSGGYDQYSWDGTLVYSSNSVSSVDMSGFEGTSNLMRIYDFANAPSDPADLARDPSLTR